MLNTLYAIFTPHPSVQMFVQLSSNMLSLLRIKNYKFEYRYIKTQLPLSYKQQTTAVQLSPKSTENITLA